MKEIMKELIKFRDERNWKQFHTAENLAKSIVLESAELLENFQWGNDKVDINNVKEEIADIVTYCLYMCDNYGLNLEDILISKIKKNREKYPVDKSFGKSDKYNKL